MPFDGSTYERRDAARLVPQLERVRNLMADGGWRTLEEISRAAGAPQASVSARLRDLRKEKFGGFRVETRRRLGGTWESRVSPREPEQVSMWTQGGEKNAVG